PCSGLGIMGKKKDIRYRLREQDLRDLAGLQREILTAAADLPIPGGLLLYSTCTLDPAENEEQAAWISERFGYELLEERTLRPDTDGCDGFYYALFRRPAES
ncbi:MAG: 16S rRNA (cytosine(967)-C(5))-methyltransferase, partial [Lachnospiraceae bacterium]|nr:16S rRNA (cytosine(967)-C(5))-methyltransferase [Lachnospiraceae bacterium]